MEFNGHPLVNEYDCPLLTLTDTVSSVSPSAITMEVSILHACTESCKVSVGGSLQVEREIVETSSRLTFQHDWSNRMFYFNV